MTIQKWAVISKSAPPQAGLRPLGRLIPTHPQLIPKDYKAPYVLRSFIKDKHLDEVQYLQNRGMYQEQLTIERARFPRWSKTFTIQTDGSLNERQFQFTVPPMMTLFQDRLYSYRQRQIALAKIGKLKKQKITQKVVKAVDSINPMCNALCFPYCVPKKCKLRLPNVDPLNVSLASTRANVDDNDSNNINDYNNYSNGNDANDKDDITNNNKFSKN